jgi:uracil-DNA glycosylase
MPSRGAAELRRLQAAHRACTRCVAAGYIAEAKPVFSGRPGQRILLVGQAPGPIEQDVERPFAGRAGSLLVRWMIRAGFTDEADFRDRVYITSVTTCFPGKRRDGAGDRRPSPAEVALCAPWLDGAIARLRPRLLITVGGLALSRFQPRLRLDDAVGEVIEPSDADDRWPAKPPLLLPLPHPSGQSRWLNDPARMALLDRALQRLGELVARSEADWYPAARSS